MDPSEGFEEEYEGVDREEGYAEDPKYETGSYGEEEEDEEDGGSYDREVSEEEGDLDEEYEDEGIGNGMVPPDDADDMFEEAMAAVDASLSGEPNTQQAYGRGAADLDDFDPYDIRAQERLELQRKSAERLSEIREEASKFLEGFYAKREESVQKVAEDNRVADENTIRAIADQSKTGWEKTISMINFGTENKPKKGPADDEKKAIDMSKYKKLLFTLRERETSKAEE